MLPASHTNPTNLPVSQQYGVPVGYQPNPTFDPVHDAFDDETGFDPLRIFWFVVHYRWLVAAFLITGLVSGIVYTFLQTPMYRAVAQLEIQTAGAKIIQDLEVLTQSNGIRVFNTAKIKMRSRDLARRVIFKLNLADKPDFLAPTASFSLFNLLKRAVGATDKADVMNRPPTEREEIAIRIIRSNMSINNIRGTNVLSVGFSHANPVYTEKVANQIISSYIAKRLNFDYILSYDLSCKISPSCSCFSRERGFDF